MNMDESSAVEEPEDPAEWIGLQREIVLAYLRDEKCEHLGVAEQPLWFAVPYVAVWPVRSKEDPDLVGWWAISGDLPTDYLPAAGHQETPDVLTEFADQWTAAAEFMTRGEAMADYRAGDPTQAPTLAPLLLARAQLLRTFAAEMVRDESTDDG